MLSAKKELFTPSGGGYQISRSVRLRNSASAYLNRTPASASDRRTWTYSGWVKRGLLNTRMSLMGGYTGTTNGTLRTDITILDGAALNVGSDQMQTATDFVLQTTQLFRDPSAWYHIVVAMDTTQATSTNRVKIYVNGVQVTAFSTATYPSLNYQGGINFNNNQYINRWFDSAGGNYYGDGYLTEINFIDGQALTPSSFGETNALTGVWQPKRYAGTYGTNGFYLPFTLNANSTYAGSFNGSSQGLTTTATGINPSTGSWTIEGWAYSTNAAANEAIITGQVSGSDYLYWNYVGTTLYIGDGVTNILTISNAKPTNQWYHWALVKNGSTYTAYINGQSIGSSTTALRSGTLTTWQIGIRTSVSYYWNGSISNVRVNSTTAIYTTKFTPPISPLTAISGTQLLTLQDATIIDNSTNAYSITNTGSVVTTTSTAVFAAPTIGSDASGNVNNWTANNINVSTTGATYDSMLDVPTLYADGGNGRGNYCTLNPLDGNSATLSGANLDFVTLSTGSANTLGSIYVPTGKWYWEQVATSNGNIAYYGIRNGPSGYYVAYYGSNGNRDVNGSTSSYGATFGNNDIIGVALDMDAGTITFYKNNVSQGAITIGNSGPFAPWIADGASGTSVTGSINFGQRPFTYTPPTGFKALNTQNLPDATIKKGNLFFNTATWSSDIVNPTIGQKSIALGFQPDLVWSKNRDNAESHYWMDSVRGDNVGNKWLRSNATAAEGADALGSTTASYVFNSTGFDIVDTNSASGEVYFNNGSASTPRTYVGWAWNAGGSTVTNTSGSISAQVRANATAGFSVVTYTGTGSAATVGHGLGVAPKMMIVKNRTNGSAAYHWFVYHASVGATDRLLLNTTGATATDSGAWNNTAPTSSVFSVGTGVQTNESGSSFVAYCFAEVAGYSAFGKYTGNGSADGPFVYCGFRPRWVMIKCYDVAGEHWIIYDTARNTYNVVTNELYANLSNAEATYAPGLLDVTANGFKLRYASAPNVSGRNYIYAAFAENPFKHSLAR